MKYFSTLNARWESEFSPAITEAYIQQRILKSSLRSTTLEMNQLIAYEGELEDLKLKIEYLEAQHQKAIA